MLNKAKEYAVKMHNEPSTAQRYGNVPYSKHLEDVVKYAEKYIYYIDESDIDDVFCSCWCHDTVEDTATTPNKLKRLFNDRIANIVLCVSNERGWDDIEILFKTLPKIRQNSLAKFVKLCDRLANTTNSKNGLDDKSDKLYKKYTNQYPVFRFALKIKGEYDDMWNELDSLYDYTECTMCKFHHQDK